jgi:phage gpG-like protein
MRILIADNIAEVAKSLEKKSEAIKEGSVVQLYNALTLLEASIKQNIRSRSGLNVRTGTLLNSVQKHIKSQANIHSGTVGPENVPYAAIHEYGGVIPEKRIEPRHGRALKWMGADGSVMFSKGHTIPSFQIRARPYLQPAMDEHIETIRNNFSLFIKKTMETNS